MPKGDPFDPVPVLTYNSRATHQAIQYGHGWADRYNPSAQPLDDETAEVITGNGSLHTYSDKDAGGSYEPPPDGGVALAAMGEAGDQRVPLAAALGRQCSSERFTACDWRIAHRKLIRHFHEPGELHELTFSCYRQVVDSDLPAIHGLLPEFWTT